MQWIKCWVTYFSILGKHIRELVDKLPKLDKILEVHHKIGEGTFSSVYLGSLKSHASLPASERKLFAIKHLVPTAHPARIEQELRCLQDIGQVYFFIVILFWLFSLLSTPGIHFKPRIGSSALVWLYYSALTHDNFVKWIMVILLYKCSRGKHNVIGVDLCLRNLDTIVFVMPYIPHKKFSVSVFKLFISIKNIEGRAIVGFH